MEENLHAGDGLAKTVKARKCIQCDVGVDAVVQVVVLIQVGDADNPISERGGVFDTESSRNLKNFFCDMQCLEFHRVFPWTDRLSGVEADQNPEGRSMSDLFPFGGIYFEFTVKVETVCAVVVGLQRDGLIAHDRAVQTKSEFRQHVYDDLYEYYLQRNAEDYENAIYNAFMELCEFKDLPETYLENVKARIEEYLTSSAAQYGMDADTFVSYAYGTDLATFIDYYAKDAAKQNIALYLVAVKEGLILEDEKLKETALEYATSYGFSDVDSYFQALGATMEEFREDYAVSEAYDLLLEIAGQ